MNTQRFDWNDATLAKAAELYHLGLSANQIATQLGGVTRNSVIGKMHRRPDLFGARTVAPKGTKQNAETRARTKTEAQAHKGKPSFTPEKVAKAMDAWARGLTAEQIGTMIGKTGKQVLSYASEHRAQFPSRKIGRQPKAAPMVRKAEPEFIAPQFLVAPEGYDAERMEHAKPLYDLEARECHWPLNNGGPFLFCAAERHQLSPYCRHHFLRSRPKVSE